MCLFECNCKTNIYWLIVNFWNYCIVALTFCKICIIFSAQQGCNWFCNIVALKIFILFAETPVQQGSNLKWILFLLKFEAWVHFSII